MCTGGASYPSTGSTGDGYKFAKNLGHSVVKPVPSLVPFVIEEDWCKELQGLSLKNVGLKLFLSKGDEKEKSAGKKKKADKPVYDGFGEMLFTHFGVSGPLVLTASCHYEENAKARLLLDLKPALSEEQLDKRILRDFEGAFGRTVSNKAYSCYD